MKTSAKRKGKHSIRSLKDAGVGHGENREWEVGCRGNYDRIDDENSLKV